MEIEIKNVKRIREKVTAVGRMATEAQFMQMKTKTIGQTKYLKI